MKQEPSNETLVVSIPLKVATQAESNCKHHNGKFHSKLKLDYLDAICVTQLGKHNVTIQILSTRSSMAAKQQQQKQPLNTYSSSVSYQHL